MKILVLFAVGVLGCSLAGAVTVTKCDLRNRLMKAFKSLPENIQQSGMAGEDFVAKIVCHVEMGSEFNTSAVTELSRDQGGSSEEGQHGGNEGKGHGENDGKGHGKNDGKGNGEGHDRRRRSPPGWMSSEEADENLTLYGIFQLCGDLVCQSNTANSTNLCGIDCSNLIDDNIDDDISCVMKLFTDILENGFKSKNLKELRKVIRLILQDDCKDVTAESYFNKCPQTTVQ
ncbi:uncharacterized protein LOC108246284 [Kryptolebias marmoratus]|uniref:uncharacterized protein LOC108246284 n=1 Tax=Kryptolebias marmoratus TaxID=37003 RepID=UPI0007F8E08F|nr:uncharacterized protein LOC108246284 [Kryptolebias marmoratus]